MKQTFNNVAENLWKSQQSGRYYAIVKVNNRQIKKSLNTDDFQLAKRKLRTLLGDYQGRGGIVSDETAPKSFKELAEKFTRIVLPTRVPRPMAQMDYTTRTNALLRYTGFTALPLNRISMIDGQRWFAKRRLMIGPQRRTMKLVCCGISWISPATTGGSCTTRPPCCNG